MSEPVKSAPKKAEPVASAPVVPEPATSGAATAPLNRLAIIGFIVSFVITFAGAILGFLALAQIRRDGGRGRQLALAAVQVGIVLTGVWVIIVVGVTLWDAPGGGRQAETEDSATRTTIVNANLAVLEYGVDHDGAFTTKVSDLAHYGFTPPKSSSQLKILAEGNEGEYCVQAVSAANHLFNMRPDGVVRQGPCGP